MNRVLALVAALAACSPVLAAEPTGEDYFNFFKALKGDWVVKGRMDGKVGEATLSVTIPATGRCLVSCSTPIFYVPAYQAIEGYDPGSRKWKWTGFDLTGGHVVAYTRLVGGSLKSKQARFQVEGTIFLPDGKKEEWRWDYTVTLGRDEWKGVCTNQTKNGEKQPDEEYAYTRKK